MNNSRTNKATWFDLLTNNPVDSMSFYEGLFDWKFLKMKEPAISDYWIIQSGSELIGGLRHVEEQVNGGAVIYFTVDELAPAVSRAKELGGKLVGNLVDMGADRGKFQWIRDRQGSVIALWASK